MKPELKPRTGRAGPGGTGTGSDPAALRAGSGTVPVHRAGRAGHGRARQQADPGRGAGFSVPGGAPGPRHGPTGSGAATARRHGEGRGEEEEGARKARPGAGGEPRGAGVQPSPLPRPRTHGQHRDGAETWTRAPPPGKPRGRGMGRLREPPEDPQQALRGWGGGGRGPPSASPARPSPSRAGPSLRMGLVTGTGGYGRVCVGPSPLPTAAGGSGRVQPFPRMRISFLPLSGDPEVSTQPWGARHAGHGGPVWEVGGRDPPMTHSPGCRSRQEPPFPPPTRLGPPTAAPAGTREPASRGARGADLQPFSPRHLPPRAQPECAADIWGGKKKWGQPWGNGARPPTGWPSRGWPSCPHPGSSFGAPSHTGRAWRSPQVQQGDPQCWLPAGRASQPRGVPAPRCTPGPLRLARTQRLLHSQKRLFRQLGRAVVGSRGRFSFPLSHLRAGAFPRASEGTAFQERSRVGIPPGAAVRWLHGGTQRPRWPQGSRATRTVPGRAPSAAVLRPLIPGSAARCQAQVCGR